MFNAITTVVGYLNAEGYCYNGRCHVRTLPLMPRVCCALASLQYVQRTLSTALPGDTRPAGIAICLYAWVCS